MILHWQIHKQTNKQTTGACEGFCLLASGALAIAKGMRKAWKQVSNVNEVNKQVHRSFVNGCILNLRACLFCLKCETCHWGRQ
jgi:hypothetical protein